MATEAELKLRLAPGDERAIRRSAALAAAPPRRRRLSAIYFDTPAGELAARGMVLRLRRDGRRWMQCLKASNVASGGLHVRDEWEFARDDPVLDLARFAGTPLAGIEDAGTLHRRLEVAFRVEVVRTRWIVAPRRGTRLEVALDRGEVRSGGRTEPVCELEIECLEGPPAAAFDLARRLLEDAALHPSTVTKAERGHRLWRGTQSEAVKARPIALGRGLAPVEAARTVVAMALAQLLANEEGVLRSDDPEFIHQARIALRRLRSVLRLFRDCIGRERSREWRQLLAGVARALGTARDWDVFATETLPALARAHGNAASYADLATRAARRRAVARGHARAALCSPEYARAALEISRWLAIAEPAAAPGKGSLARFGARIVRRRHKRLVREAANLGAMAPRDRHRVRIDVKRLRYGVEALASLFRLSDVDPYREALAGLQDALGEANDAANAMRLLAGLHPPEPVAAFARDWLGARARGDPACLAKQVDRLENAGHFWKTQER